MWSILECVKLRTILGVILLGLCGIWQIGVCSGQTDSANSGLQSAEKANHAATAQDVKDAPAGAQTALGVLPGQSTNSQTPVSPSVTLTWKASPSASKPSPDPVIGYNVYRGTNSRDYDAKPINFAPVEDTTYVDVKVEPGRTYFYVVKTVTKTAESGSSNEVEAVIPSR